MAIMVNRAAWSLGTCLRLHRLETYRQWEVLTQLVPTIGYAISNGEVDDVMYCCYRQRLPSSGNHGVSLSIARPMAVMEDTGAVIIHPCSTMHRRTWHLNVCHGPAIMIHFCAFYGEARFVQVRNYANGELHGQQLSIEALDDAHQRFAITLDVYDRGTELLDMTTSITTPRELLPLWDALFDELDGTHIESIIDRYLSSIPGTDGLQAAHAVIDDEAEAFATMNNDMATSLRAFI